MAADAIPIVKDQRVGRDTSFGFSSQQICALKMKNEEIKANAMQLMLSTSACYIVW